MKTFKVCVVAGILLAFLSTAPAQGAITHSLGAGETIWLQFNTGSDWDAFNGMTLWWNWTNGPSPADVDWSIYTPDADNGSFYDQMDAWFLPAGAFDPLYDSLLTLKFENVGTAASTVTLDRFEFYTIDAPYGYDEWCDAVYPEGAPPGLVGKVDFTSANLITGTPGSGTYEDLFYYDPDVSHQVYRSDFKHELVPVPASVLLLASGCLALIAVRRKPGKA